VIYFLALVSIALGAVAQFLIKLGSDRLVTSGSTWRTLASLFTNPQIIAGLAVFGASFLVWVFVVRNLPLSIAYPMVSLGYVIVFLLSAVYLREPVSLQKVAGIALIIAGVIIMNLH